MTDKPRKIAIVGAGLGSRLIKILLEEKLPGVEVVHITPDDIPKRRSEPGERMIICDELQQMLDTKALIAKLKQRDTEMSAECDMREFYADRRYQEPTRLRGAAAHKRQATKMKNKSRSKRK
ncbi:hypothetical protein HQ81_0172 [Dickeya phage phiDP23.1]|nr:hypothetical protein G379_gp035 [Dickeya phage vB-DsoM-LIMEstone1]YP_009102998.1 hypothetical protein DA66_0159 [Dickeya phage RC-2014]AIM51556.1 hypothetical protein HQ82_0045 [Dickeya phage phiDP10.3]AIM51877.1 hypothetical protein HQ81_0172 [Dickeya phage phiDP23.1]ASD51382.1 hypothetical protein [Dickeya phage JA15]ASD51578.1 hypothetical protein [Dickeya phage XF4]QHB41703.1 hypothetical protein [Dickeya phage Ds5CZ]QHB41906.1 hypothetical protein [Dickeya phage Ds9CZ]QHB42108.1 hyp